MKKIFLLILVLIIIALIVYFNFIYTKNILFAPEVFQEQVEQVEQIKELEPERPEELESYESVSVGIISDDQSENDLETVPPVWASYSDSLGFDKYAKFMEQKGAVIFFYSKKDNLWKKINYINSSIEDFDVDTLISGKIWGTKPAKLSKEILLNKFLKDELSSTDIYFAKPLAMEAKIEQSIRKEVANRAIKLKDLASLRGIYFEQGGTLYLKIYEFVYKNATTQGLNCIIAI